MFAGGFAHQFFELDPEIWYGHSLGYNKKLSWRTPRVFSFFSRVKGKKRYVDISKMPLTHEKRKKISGTAKTAFHYTPRNVHTKFQGLTRKID